MGERVRVDSAIAVIPETKYELAKSQFCSDATDTEFEYFVAQCNRLRLDPWKGQAVYVGRYSKKLGRKVYTFQPTEKGLLAIAERSGAYEGCTSPQWCGADGSWRDVWLMDGPPAAARVGVYKRGAREPIYGVATWREFAQDASRNPQWAGMPSHMLAKVARCIAARTAFPEETEGLYSVEEHPPAQGVELGLSEGERERCLAAGVAAGFSESALGRRLDSMRSEQVESFVARCEQTAREKGGDV